MHFITSCFHFVSFDANFPLCISNKNPQKSFPITEDFDCKPFHSMVLITHVPVNGGDEVFTRCFVHPQIKPAHWGNAITGNFLLWERRAGDCASKLDDTASLLSPLSHNQQPCSNHHSQCDDQGSFTMC